MDQPAASSSSQSSSNNPEADFEVECPICLGVMEEPKLLHCGHNLCQECAAKTGKVLKERNAHIFSVPCPLCQKTTSVKAVDGLTTNFELKGIIEKANRVTSELRGELKKFNASAEAKTVQCVQCTVELPHADAFGCGDSSCARGKPMVVSNMANGADIEARIHISIWSPMELCSRCAWSNHRHHDVYVKQLDAFATEEAILDAVKGIGEMKIDLEELFDVVTSMTRPLGNLFGGIKAQWDDESTRALRIIGRKQRPVSIKEVTSTYCALLEFFMKAQKFLDNETGSLDVLSERFRRQVTDAFNNDGGERSPRPTPSPGREWSSPRETATANADSSPNVGAHS